MPVSRIVMLLLVSAVLPAGTQQTKASPTVPSRSDQKADGKPAADSKPTPLTAPPDAVTEHTVAAGGQTIPYQAVAGTLTVGATDSEDAMLGLDGKWLADTGMNPPDPAKPEDAPATARMFYTAYFRTGVPAGSRPVIFLYNGGPGSATMWLHMGSFGPRRVILPDTEHKTAAPYQFLPNPETLLDVADLVFVDAPGTGFSRIAGKDAAKAFWSTDGDAHAFDRFIRRFLTKYDRWNSPKYLFGESYGTPRSAVLSAILQQNGVDLNGIVLLSTILNFNDSIDSPRWDPGDEQAYALALPTYAATAFYYHKLATQPAALAPFLAEVEQFALGDYMNALLKGSTLPESERQAVAAKLHGYTGLPTDYWLKANLRVEGAQFSKQLGDPEGVTAGRFDTRYHGPDLNRLSEAAEYDPQDVAISSAYTAAINGYLRTELHYGRQDTYKPGAYSDPNFQWDLRHQAPGGPPASQQGSGTNVLPDLAFTLKNNPRLKVFLAGGYFDLATPFFEGRYEVEHLPIPQSLAGNISYHYYPAGHMVYVNPDALHSFHDELAAFVRATEDGK